MGVKTAAWPEPMLGKPSPIVPTGANPGGFAWSAVLKMSLGSRYPSGVVGGGFADIEVSATDLDKVDPVPEQPGRRQATSTIAQ